MTNKSDSSSFKWEYNNLRKPLLSVEGLFETPLQFVQLPDKCHTFHGLVTWKGAFALAYYLKNNVEPLWKGAKVLELGCGTGLVGITLARLGANVVMTDLSEVLDITEQNIQLNCDPIKHHISVEEFNWCQKVLPFALQESFDFIVGAELLHYVEVYDALITTLCRLSNDKTILFFCYQKRRPQEEIKFFQKLIHFFEIYLVADEYLHPNFQNCNLVIFYGWKRKCSQSSSSSSSVLSLSNELPSSYSKILLNMT